MDSTGIKINVSQLSKTITDCLENYTVELETSIDKNNKSVAEEVCKSLKNDSNIPVKTGKYKKSFYVKKNKDGNYIVANKIGYLTHLLENGHEILGGAGHKKNLGKRSKAFKHWQPAELKARELVDKFIKTL